MISEHISFKEGTFSATATRLGLPNAPSKEHLSNMQILAKKIFDWKPEIRVQEWLEEIIKKLIY